MYQLPLIHMLGFSYETAWVLCHHNNKDVDVCQAMETEESYRSYHVF